MINAQEETRKQITPPYVSVAILERMFEFVSTHNYPSYSSDIFKKQEFNASDASWSVNALKFLGLISDDGTVTPLMAKLRLRGDARQVEVEKIVKAAYKPLFDITNEPHNLPPDKLVNEFITLYDMSRRLAESAARVFIKLCEHGGLREKSQTVAGVINPRTEKKKRGAIKLLRQEKNMAEKGKFEQLVLHVHPIVKGRMTISIPEELFLRSATDDDLNIAWRNVLKSAHKFAEEYLKKTESPELKDPETG